MGRLERRWAEALLEAFAPPGGPGLSPREGEVSYVPTLERMIQSATRLGALGLRLGLLIGALSPIWMKRRLTTVCGLSLDQRCRLVTRLLEHRWRLVRELTLLLKLAASLALLGTPSVRARSGYDRGVVPPWPRWDGEGEEEWESGTRRRLPIHRDSVPVPDTGCEGGGAA